MGEDRPEAAPRERDTGNDEQASPAPSICCIALGRSTSTSNSSSCDQFQYAPQSVELQIWAVLSSVTGICVAYSKAVHACLVGKLAMNASIAATGG